MFSSMLPYFFGFHILYSCNASYLCPKIFSRSYHFSFESEFSYRNIASFWICGSEVDFWWNFCSPNFHHIYDPVSPMFLMNVVCLCNSENCYEYHSSLNRDSSGTGCLIMSKFVWFAWDRSPPTRNLFFSAFGFVIGSVCHVYHINEFFWVK